MTVQRKFKSRASEAIHSSASALYRIGAIDKATMRSFDESVSYTHLDVYKRQALRRVDADRAEAKRLYVRAAFRGLGLGRALMEWVMAEARAAGYREIVGDTMPVMHDALALYERMGFERTGTGPKVQASTFPQVSEEPILIRIRL